MDILTVIGTIFTLKDLVLILVSVASAFGASYGFFTFIYKKEKRFYGNLKKRIVVFAPPKSSSKDSERPEDMKMEVALLKKTEFFPNLPTEIFTDTSHNNLQSIKKNTLIIVGYNDNFEDKSFLDILKKAKELDVPLIVYGYSRLEGNLLAELKKYPHHSMCETGLRLVNDVFTTLATYPYGDN